MKKKYYAVKNGKKIGIYNTWDECKLQVSGYSNAIYKSFTSLEEANAFVYGNKQSSLEEVASQKDSQNSLEDVATIYVDGSYNISTKEYSYGMLVFYKNSIEEFSKKFIQNEDSSMRNVAGELEGAKAAFAYCIKNNISKVLLYYDYQGIQSWCDGSWKTNKRGTIEYKKYYDSIKDKLDVTFKKVKGHSGDKYNDRVDYLAKKVLGII